MRALNSQEAIHSRVYPCVTSYMMTKIEFCWIYLIGGSVTNRYTRLCTNWLHLIDPQSLHEAYEARSFHIKHPGRRSAVTIALA
jgi:hypothetical protein